MNYRTKYSFNSLKSYLVKDNIKYEIQPKIFNDNGRNCFFYTKDSKMHPIIIYKTQSNKEDYFFYEESLRTLAIILSIEYVDKLKKIDV